MSTELLEEPSTQAAPKAEAVSDAFSGDATDELTGHDYDGIEEYDNPLPGWWKWLFLGCIAVGGFYLFISLLVGEQWGARSSYAAAIERQNAAMVAKLGILEPTAETLADVRDSEMLMGYGRGVFAANCASCHGTNAAGTITAPNLTDDAYLHVRKPADFLDVLQNGRNNGAMPAWQGRITDNDLIIVAGYVSGLKGTDAPGGKSAEGEIVPDWD